MNDDTISRQATIEAIKSLSITLDAETIQRSIEAVSNMPSAQSGWIPCSKRLPEPGKYYLVTRKCFGWNCTEYIETDIAKYNFDGWHKADTVLAWRELPEPWEGGKDG